MNKNVEYFKNQFEEQMKKIKRKKIGHFEYGSNVMPILDMYKNLSAFDERKSFLDALEQYLGDPDPEKRHFAVLVCLGFVVFKDIK